MEENRERAAYDIVRALANLVYSIELTEAAFYTKVFLSGPPRSNPT